MTRECLRSSKLVQVVSLTVNLVAGLLCDVARADDLGVRKSFRIRPTAFVPVGRVYSLGEISINGRRVRGEQMIWGSELVQTPNEASACVLLDSIGEVTLRCGSMVKLATATTNLDDNKEHSLLVAALTSGDIVVKLEQDAGAYIETCG